MINVSKNNLFIPGHIPSDEETSVASQPRKLPESSSESESESESKSPGSNPNPNFRDQSSTVGKSTVVSVRLLTIYFHRCTNFCETVPASL